MLDLSGHCLARQFLVLHCGVVKKRRHDCGRLFQIISLNPIEYILIRMMSARVILNLILDKLKAGQTEGVKR
jgi:hypothetical protein